MTKPIIKPIDLKWKRSQLAKITTISPKQKQKRLVNNINNKVKKNWVAFDFYYIFGFFFEMWVIYILKSLG